MNTTVLEDELVVVADPEASEMRPKAPRHHRLESWLYRAVWRWHFYAGLIVSPVLLTAAITGGLWAFAEEIDDAIYHRAFIVEPGTSRIEMSAIVAAARAFDPGETPSAVQYSDDPERATAVEFHTPDHRHRYVYVNPYTAEVTGGLIYEEGLMAIVLDIHRTLLAGTPGRIVVELATGWGVILVATGVYLWWPRRRDKVKGVWTLRMKGRFYTVVRDLHTVPGFYVSILAVIVLVTGLVFSFGFGQGFQALTVATGGYPKGFIEPPVSAGGEGTATIDRIVATVRAQGLHHRVYLAYPDPETPGSTYVAYAGDAANPTTRSAVWIDPQSAEVVDFTDWDGSSALFKATMLAYPLHVGSIYGLPTKILAAAVCLLIVTMTVTGALMWLKRRPTGRSGFPRKPERARFPLWLGLTVGAVGILVPAVGATVLVLVSWDGLVAVWRQWRSASHPEPGAG